MTDTMMTGIAKDVGGKEVTTNTWTLLPDIEDPPPRPCQVEQMQIEYLQEHLGLTLWAWLEEKLDG
jgi:hypothetical protein